MESYIRWGTTLKDHCFVYVCIHKFSNIFCDYGGCWGSYQRYGKRFANPSGSQKGKTKRNSSGDAEELHTAHALMLTTYGIPRLHTRIYMQSNIRNSTELRLYTLGSTSLGNRRKQHSPAIEYGVINPILRFDEYRDSLSNYSIRTGIVADQEIFAP